MQFVNIHDAKTHLSKYLGMLSVTHEPIVICKNGVPIAQLTEYHPRPIRHLGLCKGKIEIAADFDEMPKEFMDYFQ